MILLALDTAMAACSAALVRDDGAVLAERFVPMDKGHAEALPPMVQDVMDEAGLAFSDISRIAVTTGPGTFTGVRIGLAFARGLGVALGVPVIGIDTLSAIAANASGQRLVVSDARKDEVYTVLIAADGTLVRAPAVMALDRALSDADAGTTVLGSAADEAMALNPRLVRAHGDLPVAATFGRAALALPSPSGMPAPLYLRAADAKPQAGYVLRKLAPTISETDDAAAVAAMHAECFDHPWTDKDCRDLMNMPGAVTFVAHAQDEPAGFLMVRVAAGEAEIITLGTRPQALRRGVAQALLTHASAQLAAAGSHELLLEVAAGNGAARALYAACGFSEVGTRKNYYDRGGGAREDAIIMRRPLQP